MCRRWTERGTSLKEMERNGQDHTELSTQYLAPSYGGLSWRSEYNTTHMRNSTYHGKAENRAKEEILMKRTQTFYKEPYKSPDSKDM